MENKKIKIFITHDGKFHTDDIFACATLALVFEKNNETFKLIRTRDEEIISTGDYVFDVGGVYDEENNKFDHHQIGGAGKRENGIEYASFGLVWKKYGVFLCGSEKISINIDKKLVQPIDADDNGITISKNIIDDIHPYELHNIISAFLPTREEKDSNKDEIFLDLVSFAKKILNREIIRAKQKDKDEKELVNIYNQASDKRLLILDQPYSGKDVLLEFHEPLYTIFQREDANWILSTVKKEKDSFQNRKNLPEEWAGLRDEEFQKITGVADAIFCHRALFLAVAKSKEGAMKLAELALENK